ncbi:MAG: hypothetical protein ACLFVD_04975 [Dehalococcoidia bacterium]
MMNIEAEVRDLKQQIVRMSRKIDELLSERETAWMMRLAETSLSAFLEREPDVYKVEDLKVRYR